MVSPQMTQTHETYIQAVCQAARQMVQYDPIKLGKLNRIKVVYGLGQFNLRGVTYYGKWELNKIPQDLIEICAFGQENWTQVAGTTIHELGHVLAGSLAGHDTNWKLECECLGLMKPKAQGHNYSLEGFSEPLRQLIQSIPLPQDGSPLAIANALGITPRIKPCTMGIGVRGGKSQGIGSGSRMIKCECPICGYTVRTTAKWLAVGKPICPTDQLGME